VGTWACTGTITFNVTSPGQPIPDQAADGQAIVSANADGTLSVKAEQSDGGGPPCTTAWTVSGASATIKSGQTCTYGSVTFAYSSGTFTPSGNTAAVHEVSTGTGEAANPDGGASPVPDQITATATTTCTKQ
jgi:hypothetical protein